MTQQVPNTLVSLKRNGIERYLLNLIIILKDYEIYVIEIIDQKVIEIFSDRIV